MNSNLVVLTLIVNFQFVHALSPREPNLFTLPAQVNWAFT
uniref:Uncharacterized protein n=1 Tax=Rhizophora mucronata TaxID=61149 RepID=A0A2P2P6L8_RHIMU